MMVTKNLCTTATCILLAIVLLIISTPTGFSADTWPSKPVQGAKQQAESSNQGIWKSVVPPNPMISEFDAHDPIGLAAGAKIKTDCSINWVSPDSHRRYCFASGTSLVYFLRWPKRNAGRAELGWKKIKALTH